MIASEESTDVTVSIPGLSFSSIQSVTAGETKRIDLPSQATLGDIVDTPTNLGIHVTSASQKTITVYGQSQRKKTTDSFLAIPSNSVGNEYLLTSWKTDPNSFGKSQAAIIATSPNTLVSLYLPGSTTPTPIQLAQGQAYQWRLDAPGQDLTGARIVSNNPIAVLAGNSCGLVPTDEEACDYLVEQLTPTSTWGSRFLTTLTLSVIQVT